MNASNFLLLIQYITLVVQISFIIYLIRENRKRKKAFDKSSQEFEQFLKEKKTEFMNHLVKQHEQFANRNLNERQN